MSKYVFDLEKSAKALRINRFLHGLSNLEKRALFGNDPEKAMQGLQAGAPSEVRRVLSGEWPINVVNRAVRGRNRAGL